LKRVSKNSKNPGPRNFKILKAEKGQKKQNDNLTEMEV